LKFFFLIQVNARADRFEKFSYLSFRSQRISRENTCLDQSLGFQRGWPIGRLAQKAVPFLLGEQQGSNHLRNSQRQRHAWSHKGVLHLLWDELHTLDFPKVFWISHPIVLLSAKVTSERMPIGKNWARNSELMALISQSRFCTTSCLVAQNRPRNLILSRKFFFNFYQ
jgi:hypothetical protein